MILPIIMAGGSGSRLWPMSRTHYPKQFLSLNSKNTMLQETILRLARIPHEPVSIICNNEHRFIVAEQLQNKSIPFSSIILEPCGRNTAPAVCITALQAIKNGSDPLLLVLAADHIIKNELQFTEAIQNAKKYAENGKLVTFGIRPSSPEIGYGYIHKSNKITIDGLSSAYTVNSFVEKPDLDTAINYLSSGEYYWNSGMFLFKASRYLEELNKFRPDILEACKTALEQSAIDLDFIRLDQKSFEKCPDESIDYAVMEKTTDAVVIPMDAGWSDVGSWSSLWEVSDKDNSGNVLKGDILQDNISNCYISSPHRLIATLGLENLIIIDTKDALLVAHRTQVQNIKSIVSQLKKENRTEFLHHREIYRPWGLHDHIADGERYHVKKIIVKPGEKTATQLHYHRSEHWIIVSGTAKIYKDDDVCIISENQSIFIPIGTKHSFENPGKVPLVIIEVRTGIYLHENDIIRFDMDTEGD